MRSQPSNARAEQKTNSTEPRWVVVLAMPAAGALYFVLPKSLSVGPRWLPLAMVAVLLLAIHLTQHRDPLHRFGFQTCGHSPRGTGGWTQAGRMCGNSDGVIRLVTSSFQR
jgi:hypothetical protein